MAGRAGAWFALLVLLLCATAAQAVATPPRVTVFGDSVQASFLFTPGAVRHLQPGIDLQMQAQACRKLSSPGCIGGSPPSVLTVANALGSRLGDVVVVHVGYNDFAPGYDIDAVMRSFNRSGVKVVVWVLLREAHSNYVATNARIRDAARRANRRRGGPAVRIADWNAFSAGRPWFVSDRVHLNAAGAMGLAVLLRDSVVQALATIGVVLPGPPVRIDPVQLTVRQTTEMAADPEMLWLRGPAGLIGIDPDSGIRTRRRARLRGSESLTSDGMRAWVTDTATTMMVRATRRFTGSDPAPVSGIGAGTALARTDGWLWALGTCAVEEPACEGTHVLARIDPVSGLRASQESFTTPVQAIAADRSTLWVAIADATGSLRLERRAQVTGRVLRTVPLPRIRTIASLAAGPHAAWVVTGEGTLVRVGLDGRLARLGRSVRRVVTAGNQVWVLRRDARTVDRLAPESGRPRLRVISRRRLRNTIAVTARHLWLLPVGGHQLLRVTRS